MIPICIVINIRKLYHQHWVQIEGDCNLIYTESNNFYFKIMTRKARWAVLASLIIGILALVLATVSLYISVTNDAYINTIVDQLAKVGRVSSLACDSDSFMCSDGSVVGRDPNNNCEFSECNLVSEPMACTMEAKLCPDGSYVGRDSNNNCEFTPCP